MTDLSAIQNLVLVAIAAPLGLLLILGITSLLDRTVPEQVTGVLAPLAFFLCLTCLGAAGVLMLSTGVHRETLVLGRLLAVGDFEFQLHLLVDPLSITFAIFAETLCGVVAAFAHRYLHREPGYNRFFLLLATFSAGMMFIILAGSMEVLFAGWEFVGVSSALLIAFFHDRPAPAKNGLWTFIVYRVTDIGMLAAAVLIHHNAGSGEFSSFLGTSWPDGRTSLTTAQATAAGLFLLFSAMGKCAQFPFSGWLPRAMEGPTPSSAIFYGALSVHAGAYLLLRMGPLFDKSPFASAMVVAVGLTTAVFATLVGRVQTDIKTALAYASLTQVGIILAEIGLGLRWLALLHMIGHAALRSLQLLRSPSMLHDFHNAEAAVGGHLAHTGMHLEKMFPEAVKWRLYRFALEKGYVDSILDRFVVVPFVRVMKSLDTLEARWCRFLGGSRKGSEGRS